jgi:hypothetical protein
MIHLLTQVVEASFRHLGDFLWCGHFGTCRHMIAEAMVQLGIVMVILRMIDIIYYPILLIDVLLILYHTYIYIYWLIDWLILLKLNPILFLLNPIPWNSEGPQFWILRKAAYCALSVRHRALPPIRKTCCESSSLGVWCQVHICIIIPFRILNQHMYTYMYSIHIYIYELCVYIYICADTHSNILYNRTKYNEHHII